MLDIKKLKELQKDIKQKARQEQKEEFIQFLLNSSDFNIDAIEDKYKPDLDISNTSRTLNHWAENGIIPPVEKGKQKRYDRVETIWIEIVITLRDFGLTLDAIKNVKYELFDKTHQELGLSMLHYAFLHSILVEPYILMVYANGNVNFMSKSKYLDYQSEIEEILPPHIYINLLNIAEKLYPHNSFTQITNGTQIAKLNDKEIKLLYFLRTGDYESIKIRLKNGEAYLLEGTKKVNANTNSIKAINNCEFQDIEIKMKSGKTACISVTEFKKI